MIFLLSQISGAAEQCRFYFGQAVTTESSSTEMISLSNDNVRSKIKIEQVPLEGDVNAAASAIMKMLVNGTSYILDEKIALHKGTMELGIPVKNGYTLLAVFESTSTAAPRFTLDKIFSVSPTGVKEKIAEKLISPNEFTLTNSEFDLPTYFPQDYLVRLKIPLVIEGPALEKLYELAKYFKFFSKEELRKIFNIESSVKRKIVLQVGKAKSVLKSVIIKQPFKIAVQGIMLGVAIHGANYMLTNYNINLNPFQAISNHTQSIVEKSISSVQFESQPANVKAQFKAVVEEAEHKITLNEPYTGPKISKVLMNSANKFSLNASTWVFEKIDSTDNSKHTYMVFSEEKTVQNIEGIQYYIMEIDAAKYADLIRAIKATSAPR